MLCKSSETFCSNSLVKNIPTNCIFEKINTIWNNNFWCLFFFKYFIKIIFFDLAFDFVCQYLVEQCGARQCKMFKCWNQHFQKSRPTIQEGPRWIRPSAVYPCSSSCHLGFLRFLKICLKPIRNPVDCHLDLPYERLWSFFSTWGFFFIKCLLTTVS